MTSWLTIIGVGAMGVESLAEPVQKVIQDAEVIIGSERLFSGLSGVSGEIHKWTTPLSDMIARINNWRYRRVVILATGDPMHFGIGSIMAQKFPRNELRIISAPSAFSMAAAKLGWPLQDVKTLSAHGRPVSALTSSIQPGAKLLILTEGSKTVHQIGECLVKNNFGRSLLVVLENLGGAAEKITVFSALKIANQTFSDLNLVAVDCELDPGQFHQPSVPGLADKCYENDGLLTKREIRSITIASLMPAPGHVLWDVGAGCGSVAIEWMRCGTNMGAIAFEKNGSRIATIKRNAEILGAPAIKVIPGLLPETLNGQTAPDSIFHGGAVSSDEIFNPCWTNLKFGGFFVANAVTIEGEAALIKRHKEYGGELIRISISHSDKIGTLHSFNPQRPVTHWRVCKS